jgi:hypothetical protein
LPTSRAHVAARAPEVSQLDTSRLSSGEKVIGVCSGLLVLLSFFPLWAKYEFTAGDETQTDRYNAWSDAYPFLMKFAILLAATALLLVVLRAIGSDFELPIDRSLLYGIICGAVALILIVMVFAGPREFGADQLNELGDLLGVDAGSEVSRGLMLFVGAILGGASLFGAYVHMQGETTAPSSPTTPPPAS